MACPEKRLGDQNMVRARDFVVLSYPLRLGGNFNAEGIGCEVAQATCRLPVCKVGE